MRVRTRPAAGAEQSATQAAESEGLRFLRKVAEVVCYECDATHELEEEPAAYVITISGHGEALKFYFDRAEVDDIDGESFRLAAMRFLERCLQTFRNDRVH